MQSNMASMNDERREYVAHSSSFPNGCPDYRRGFSCRVCESERSFSKSRFRSAFRKRRKALKIAEASSETRK